MFRVTAIASIGLLAAALCAGQTKPAAHQRETPSAAAKASQAKAAPLKPDATIEATIRAKFSASKINADKFQVHVQGGVATLEGRTDVVQHKGVATRLAKTGGALAVNNHIQVSDAARKKAADNLEKGRRRAQIKRGDARSDPQPPRTGK